MALALFPHKTRTGSKDSKSPRRLSEGIFVACPLAFSAFVAIYSRHYDDQFQVPTSTPQQEEQVLAYAPFVKEERLVIDKPDLSIDRNQLLKVACDWEQGIKSGTLQALPKVSFEDSIQQGVRGQILHSDSMLISSLFEDAQVLAAEGQVNRAAEEVMLGVKLSEGLKYSDFNTVFLSDVVEKRAADFLRKYQDGMSSATKDEAKQVFANVISNSKNLGVLTRESRVQYYDWTSRITQSPISLDHEHLVATLTDRITSNPSSRNALFYTETSVMDSDDNSPVYLSELRMAWRAETNNRRFAMDLVRDM